MAKIKTIRSKLLVAHDNLTAEFWLNHDIKKCVKCQEVLKN